MPRTITDPAIRFWRHVDKSGNCWIWTASRYPNGYGVFGISRKSLMSAHRYSWTLANGEIPPGICVLHRCDVRTCVRPDHLFLGTQQDNLADMTEKGRRRGRWSRERVNVVDTPRQIKPRMKPGDTHCPRGHEMTPENTYVPRPNQRACKACARLRHLRKRHGVYSTSADAPDRHIFGGVR